MRTPRTNTSILLAAFAATALAFVGCEVIVGPDQLDTIHCNDEGHIGAPACPDDLQCNGGVCTAPKGTSGGAGGQDASVGGSGGSAGGGGDAATGGSGGDAGSSGSAGTGGAAGASGIGGASGTGGSAGTGGKDAGPKPQIGDDCTGDVTKCGTELLCRHLPSNPKQSICTKLCCGVSQCNPAGSSNNRYLCAPYSTNSTYSTGNVCLPVAEVIPDQSSVGTSKLGAPCSGDLDCASGLCTSVDGKGFFCTEACCSNIGGSPDCIGGPPMGCSLSSHTIGQSTVPMGLCEPSNGKLNQKDLLSACDKDSTCVSNVCMPYTLLGKTVPYCNSLCCSDEQCEKNDSLPGANAICEYVLEPDRSTGRPVRECVAVLGNWRASPMKPCCSDLNCDVANGYGCREMKTPVFELKKGSNAYSLDPTPTSYPVYRCQKL